MSLGGVSTTILGGVSKDTRTLTTPPRYTDIMTGLLVVPVVQDPDDRIRQKVEAFSELVPAHQCIYLHTDSPMGGVPERRLGWGG